MTGRAIWVDSHIGLKDRMKRSIFADLRGAGWPMICIAATICLSGCSSPQPGLGQEAPETSGWVTPPLIERADRTPQGLILRGKASPSGRVVVRGEGDVGYATGADQTGRFVLRIAAPSKDTLFVVETQSGQDAFPAPERLLVAHGPQGVVALLTPGAPSRRLDRALPFAALDTDGRTLLASGQAVPGGSVPVSLGDAPSAQIKAGSNGRWTISVPPGTGVISIGDRRYLMPPLSVTDGTAFSTIQTDSGLRVAWSTPSGGKQMTWFPAE